VAFARWKGPNLHDARVIEIHGQMPGAGGWSPSALRVAVGETLQVRLTSDDVVHGFAIGRLGWPAIDVNPGQVTETSLTFDQPGRYVFYCTRWCGPEHWRMRGTIDVIGSLTDPAEADYPLYMTLDLDLDAAHPATVVPAERPKAERGTSRGPMLGADYLTPEFYRSQSPADAWLSLRSDPALEDLQDMAIWDLVAWIWDRNTTPEALREGERLYRVNCAACHGEGGEGDGVMAPALKSDSLTDFGHATVSPAAFNDPSSMLGASPALLHGKVIRGGMGTGMPYWGPIFSEDQAWAVVDYLWTFQLDRDS
jgi:mono/diheme cytochrome c family protein/plastocyanin